jgi:hypothetical protein
MVYLGVIAIQRVLKAVDPDRHEGRIFVEEGADGIMGWPFIVNLGANAVTSHGTRT